MDVAELDLSDPLTAEQFWRVRETALSAGRPRFQWTTLEDFRELLGLPDERARRRYVGVRQGRSLVGAAMLLVPNGAEATDVWVYPYVPPAYRRDQIGTTLIEDAVAYTQSLDRTRLLSSIEFAGDNLMEAGRHPYVCFARTNGFEIGRRVVTWEQALPLNEDTRASFQEAIEKRTEGYRVEIVEGLVPAEQREAYLALRTAAAAAAPETGMARPSEAFAPDLYEATTAMWLGQGHRIATALVFDPDDELVALSTVRVPPKPDSAATLQGDTFVADKHRRRRIGPMVKLALMDWLTQTVPERNRVQTSTAEVNRRMASLNRALGYEPIETLMRVARRIPPRTEAAEAERGRDLRRSR